MVAALEAMPGRHCRVMPEAGDTELFGGIDLSESLVSGRLVEREGLLQRANVLWVTRAERMPVRMAARIAAAMDTGGAESVVLCDESDESDDLPPAALRDRLAFFLCDTLDADLAELPAWSDDEILSARERLGTIVPGDDVISLAVRVAAELGCRSNRPALFLLRTARALAALDGDIEITSEHIQQAARLVLPHRAQARPEKDEESTQSQVENPENSDPSDGGTTIEDMLRDIVLEAACVQLPDDLLAALSSRDRKGAGSGHGAERVSRVRGRPLPSRSGTPDGRARLDLLATLQAAAPWQKLRETRDGRLAIRKSDLRIRRYRERSERMLLFAVDASGSAAMARLAEAKGAAETILGEAYRSRDHVSLITFRGDTADCVLEPTRSLVRAKRLLGGLPGGGTTPLAAALRQCALQASLARRKGLTPHVILMTDGRANRALDGSTDRVAARDEALQMARYLGAMNVPALVVDSGLRPSADLDEIARVLGARMIRLPRGHRAMPAAKLVAALDQ